MLERSDRLSRTHDNEFKDMEDVQCLYRELLLYHK